MPQVPKKIIPKANVAGYIVTEEDENDYDDEYIRALVYGETGRGKTRVVGSAQKVPEMAPALILNFDKGLQSLNYKVARVKFDKWRDADLLLRDLVGTGSVKLKDGRRLTPKTVIIDTATEMYAKILQMVMDESLKKRPEKDPDVPEQHDYMKAHSIFRKVIRSLRDMPINILVTAQRDYMVDEITGAVLGYSPNVTGKLNRELGQWFRIIGYVDVTKHGTEQEFTFNCMPSNRWQTKDSKNAIPGELVFTEDEPIMGEIYHYYFPKAKAAGVKKKVGGKR